MISHTYSKSYLQSSISLRHQTAAILHGRLLPLLASTEETTDRTSAGINVQSVFLATSMDFISAYIYGLARSTDFLRDGAYRARWIKLYNARNEHHFWPQEMPGLTKTLRWVGVNLVDDFVNRANEELAQWNWDLCERTRGFVFGPDDRNKAEDEEKGRPEMRAADDPVDEPVVFKAIHAGIDKEFAAQGENSLLYSTTIRQRDKSVASELFDHVTAGQETSGITLTYLAHHLSQDPDLQARLRAELLTMDPPLLYGPTSGDMQQVPCPRDLDALPLLHAVLVETLRLNAPIPGPQPRQTPYPSCTLDGYYIPGGVRVAAAAHSLHRAEDVFDDAETWRPGRWVGASEERKREMGRLFWAFGSGGRMCIGSNFAIQGGFLFRFLFFSSKSDGW
jgi:cytochrome P450